MVIKCETKRNRIVVTHIFNESQLDLVLRTTEKAGCQKQQLDASTKVVVSGTPAQLNAFVAAWNAEVRAQH